MENQSRHKELQEAAKALGKATSSMGIAGSQASENLRWFSIGLFLQDFITEP